MPNLRDSTLKIRSKNAGPFWLTIDIFCGTDTAYQTVVNGLQTSQISAAFGINTQDIKRFDIPDLNVIKFSLPRPTTQGSPEDRDLHGASWAALIAEIDI